MKSKKRSRSRSRSYSPGYNRDRNHPRVYQNRDFRGHNRGYRRPYYFRGRGRGFYPRGQHNRGGYINYRPNWQNYNRQPYSPRRARSRSRSPKRRSVSPRSRSHSRNSDKSSSDRSRRSSSSRSSSNHSRVETRRKSKKDKKSHSKDQRSSAQVTDDESKEQSTSGGADPGSKEGSKSWQDIEAYDESPATQHSPSERAPTLKSSVQSVVVRRCSPRPSPGQKPSPPSPTGLQSSSSFRASSRQSPFEHSLSPPRKSPLTKSPPSMSSLYGSSQKEEGRSGEMTAPVGTGYKRFMEEQKNKALELEKENGKEKLKDRSSPTDFAMSELERAYKKSMSPKRYKMREELEKLKLAELRYAKEEAEHEKKSRARKDSDSDSKSQDPYDPAKWEELSFIPSTKEKRKKSEDLEDELYAEKSKKEEKASKFAHKGFLPEKNFKVTSFKASKERSESPPPRKSSESREKQLSKEDLSLSKSNFSVSRETGPSVRLDSFDEDLARPSGVMTHERKLSRDLVHSNKKDQEFKSIFQHIHSAQSQRSPSELFAQHIVTIVHHVKEHHFGPSTMTLSERFSSYSKKVKEQEPSKSRKSPEIHRRIDISPSAFRKHGILQEEGKQTKEGSHKGEGKYKEEPSDLRQDIERRKKHKDKRDHSRDSGDSRDSSRSRERSSEKPEKPKKSSKKHKKHRKVRERSRSSSSSSHSSHSVRAAGTDEFPTENEDKDENSSNFEKARLGNKEYQGTSDRGRARGTFQYRARGTRPWNSRGSYSGNNNNNNNDFQKRNRDEEWDPEYTPKSKKYYLHDDREGENEEKWVNRGRGRANFTRGRGRFLFRKPGASPKWSHDKFSGEEGEIEEDESGAENKDEKGSLSLD
ncbi:thyroid hormone receptor-associated protein 3 isoform X2 [Bufo gargarizans]|uniref:thyroid hormone receptor-associated protein 3 isoform X2 n=1 Tax=Bufo gargarizans TaxID=30331 RepID=UPI001CF5B287|nr:thyroid hormone receptor-associated protein 3 isoform X2 [Bufo gargarizans]